MKNYLKKLSANILISTAIYSVTTLNSYAAQGLFETDEDIQVAIDSGFKKVIGRKSVEQAQRHKVSHKGDLTAIYNMRINNTHIKRREFYMLGDGNCALWSMGTDHATAQALILANSNNLNVRQLAHQEIVDEFNNLPNVMKDAEYNRLSAALAQAHMMLQMDMATPEHPEYDAEFRADILRQETAIRQEIKLWAQTEQVFRNYVTHVLTDGHYMLFRQDVNSLKTYFIDALAHLMNKNLIIWSQVNTQSGNLINAHPGNSNHLIQAAHIYAKGGADATLEIIHRGNHYNRIVAVNDNPGLLKAAQDETNALQRLAELLETRSTTTIMKDDSYLNFQFYEAILKDNSFSAQEKDAIREDYENLKKLGVPKHQVSPQVMKAYCLASMEVYEKHREKLISDSQLDPDELERKALAIMQNIAPNLRTNNNYMNRMRMQSMLGVQNARAVRLKKQKAVEELPAIEKKLALFEKMSNKIKLNVNDTQIFEVLNKIILKLGVQNEELLVLKEQKEQAGEETDIIEAKYEQSVTLKNLYEGIYREYQAEFLKNLPRRLKSGLRATQDKVSSYLATDPVIHGISLKDDFDNAKSKLEQIARQEQQAGRPYLNPVTLMYDPFLASHNRDINVEYPKNIEWDEFMDILQDTKKAILKILVTPESREHRGRLRTFEEFITDEGIDLKNFSWLGAGHRILQGRIPVNDPLGIPRDTWIEVFNNLHTVFNRTQIENGNSEAETQGKHILRKRIKRLLDALIKNSEAQMEDGADPEEVALQAWAKFGALMAQNTGRCIDGVSSGVQAFEASLVFGEGGTPLLEQKISKLIINDRHDFILQHGSLGGGIEEPTAIPEMALQRLRHVMSLRGATRALAYPGFSLADDARFAPAKIMERYLKGDREQPRFQARTPNYLAEMLYQAHMRANNKIKGKGELISLDEINTFIANDLYMQPLYLGIVDRVADGAVGISNNYFEESKGMVYAKKAFFTYALKRLGYVIDPRDPTLNLLAEEKPVVKDEFKKKLVTAFQYHKGRKVPRFTGFDSATEGKIIQLAYQYAQDGTAPADTSALDFALKKFAGYGRLSEIATVINQSPVINRELHASLTSEEKEKIALYSSEYLSKNKMLDVRTSINRAAYRAVGERHFSQLQYVFNYHKDNGRIKFQGFNKAQENQILQIAGALVVKEGKAPDTTALDLAIDKFWSKQYKVKLSTMLQSKKRQRPFSSLDASQEKEVIKDALNLVEKGASTFEEALIKTASAVSANQYKDSLRYVLSSIRSSYPRSELAQLNEQDSQRLIDHASLLVAEGRVQKVDSDALKMALREINNQGE